MSNIIDINVNRVSRRVIGIMGKTIYKDDELVLDLKKILEENDVRLPSNSSVNETLENKIKLDPFEFNKISMKAYCRFMCYRHSFAFKKISTEMADCINNIYYFVGIYNMLNTIGSIHHNINFDKRNLMLQSSYRSYFWERTNEHVKESLRCCLQLINKRSYKETVETFFKNGESNDYYLSAFYYTIDLPNLTPDIYTQLGFLKIKRNKYDLYLLPSYLLGALNPEDKLYLLNKKDTSLFEEENLSDTITGQYVRISYIPYHKDQIHLMYGFKINHKEVY